VRSRNAVIDLIKAADRGRRTQLAGRRTWGAIHDHAGGASTAFHAASAWAPPCWLGVAIHAGRVCIRIAIVAQIREPRWGLGGTAAAVVCAATARDTVAPIDAVPVSHWFYCFSLRHQLRRASRVVHAVDFLVVRSRGLGNVRAAVFAVRWSEGAGRAVEAGVWGVRRADGHGRGACVRPRHGLVRVASGSAVRGLGACPRADRGAGRLVRGHGRRRVVGGNDAVGARPWGAGTVGRIIVVRVRKRASGGPRGVGISAPRRGRALVSRLHGGGGGVGDGVDVVFGGDGDALEAELELCGLGGGGTGERVTARGQRGRAATGNGVPAQADRLRGQEDAAQHDCQPVKHETRGARMAQTKKTRRKRAQS
jgi:hypothetical protein